MHPLQSYELTIWAAAAVGLLLLVQLLVVDVLAIKAGHRPGMPIPADSGNLLFRAARAHANTNESVAVFALFALAGIGLSASPTWLGGLAWLYVAARCGHMAAYYANLVIARSSAFGVSLIALGGMSIIADAICDHTTHTSSLSPDPPAGNEKACTPRSESLTQPLTVVASLQAFRHSSRTRRPLPVPLG